MYIDDVKTNGEWAAQRQGTVNGMGQHTGIVYT